MTRRGCADQQIRDAAGWLLTMLVHVDTDFGGDPDDACALAMLLGWADVELAGVTTTLDHQGRRAGCARYVLDLGGHSAVPVVAGSSTTLTGHRFESTWGDPRHWPEPIRPVVNSPGAALDLLAASIERDAIIVAIGGFTNLAMLELMRPGSLAGADVVAMAGWFVPVAPGLPRWGPEMDFNVQADVRAAEIVAAASSLTLVPMTTAMGAWLRRRDLDRLRDAGRLGALLARQSEIYCEENALRDLAQSHPTLAPDLVNFHWDPLTCAVAVGWPHVQIESKKLSTQVRGAELTFTEDARGRDHRVVTAFDVDRFADTLLSAIDRAGAHTAESAKDPASA